jgi:hypothetical protein
MNIGFLAAGGISAFALVLHLMLGRSRPLPPLLADDPSAGLHVDAWFGRHAVTLMLAAMAMGFSHAARAEGARDLALTLAALSLGMAGLKLLFALRVRARSMDLGEWGLPALAGVAALYGLYAPA